MRRLLQMTAVVIFSFLALSACNNSSDGDSENSVSYPISLNSTFGDRDEYNFVVNSVGPIWAEVTWAGTAANLALILNGPGQVGYFARVDGPSPLSLSYPVTLTDISKGPKWTISVVNFGGGVAVGNVKITYPAD